MTHQNAVEQMSVERYLLGELIGATRDQFEEHLFDCAICATDLKHGVQFLDAAIPELRVVPRSAAAPKPSPLAWLFQPWVLAPALAACLAVILFQSAVLLPRAHAELAAVETPAILPALTLANAGARGASTLPEITARPHSFYLLAVDVPPVPGASGYRCSLVSSAGAEVWHLDLSPEQIHDAVTIQVPSSIGQPGVQELRMQSISPNSGTLVPLTSYRYNLILR